MNKNFLSPVYYLPLNPKLTGVLELVLPRLPIQRTRFLLRLFFCYCRKQVGMCRASATNKKIFVGNRGYLISE